MKLYKTESLKNLWLKFANLVYGIKCGLIYVGETLVNGHMFEVNIGGNHIFYQPVNLPHHYIQSMNIRLLEKLYHPTI